MWRVCVVDRIVRNLKLGRVHASPVLCARGEQPVEDSGAAAVIDEDVFDTADVDIGSPQHDIDACAVNRYNLDRPICQIAGLIADPGALAVRADSRFGNWQDVKQALQNEGARLLFGGGSVRGNLDHIVLSLIARAEGVDPRLVRYLPYDGGGKAMLALLSGEAEVLVSGLGETISQHEAGAVRILAIASQSRSGALPQIPTFAEMGTDVTFANWRGLFAPLDASERGHQQSSPHVDHMQGRTVRRGGALGPVADTPEMARVLEPDDTHPLRLGFLDA